jgi:saccharopine dehydrogenase-like NADP-dependent oxidoreductase
MKHIVIFGAGKSATVCINYLATKALNHFKLSVADVSAELLAEKTAQFDHVHRVVLDISNDNDRSALIATADVVISLLPPHLHIKAALDCLHHKKHLINASYVAPEIRALDSEAIKNNLLFLSEMGLDPGIDHMSAMALIHQLQEEGNTITSFYSHCGGLVAPESDNNPWHYKISWNPRNVVLAGKSGATFLENGITKTLTYENLFNENNLINKNTANEFAWYANRDSLSYINTYNLQGVSNFLRTTLRHKKFIEAWKEIVVLGLTDDTEKHTSVAGIQSLDIDNYTKATQYLLDKELIKNYSATNFTNADLLQYLLEHKLALKPDCNAT